MNTTKLTKEDFLEITNEIKSFKAYLKPYKKQFANRINRVRKLENRYKEHSVWASYDCDDCKINDSDITFTYHETWAYGGYEDHEDCLSLTVALYNEDNFKNYLKDILIKLKEKKLKRDEEKINSKKRQIEFLQKEIERLQ